MGSAVKKIAKVAAFGALAFYGGQALATTLASSTAGVSYAGATHLGAMSKFAAPGVGSSIFGSGLVSKVGLGLQGVSYMQQRKFASAQAKATKQAAEEQRRINEMQERVRLVQERRQRLDILRQERIQQGTMTAETGSTGLGMQGTSGYLGATGAIQTQATANISENLMASGASTAISRASQTKADYETAASLASGKQTMYKSLGGFGGFLSDKSDEIGNIFKINPFK